MGVTCEYDSTGDVLYVRYKDSEVRDSIEAPGDPCTILNLDGRGKVVGLQMLHASNLGTFWRDHPDRYRIPGDIARAVDGWVAP